MVRDWCRAGLVLALAGGLAACGSPPDDAPAAEGPAASAPAVAEATPAAAPGARPAAFAQCAACHAVEPGKHGVGPSLFGVHGTKSGEIAGYAFSDAMRKAGLTWDDATLDAYLAAPMKTVPGTKMAYAGMPDPARRQEVIAYLKSLK